MGSSAQPILRKGGDYAPTTPPPEVRGLRRDVFFVEIDFTNLPNTGVQVPGSFTVDADADLVLTGGQAVVTTVADRTTQLSYAAVFAKVRRTAAGRDITSDFVPLFNLLSFQGMARPGRWESPMLLRANSNFVVTLTSVAAAALYVQLTFNGYKVFTVGT